LHREIDEAGLIDDPVDHFPPRLVVHGKGDFPFAVEKGLLGALVRVGLFANGRRLVRDFSLLRPSGALSAEGGAQE